MGPDPKLLGLFYAVIYIWNRDNVYLKFKLHILLILLLIEINVWDLSEHVYPCFVTSLSILLKVYLIFVPQFTICISPIQGLPLPRATHE